MSQRDRCHVTDRRTFMERLALLSGAALAAGYTGVSPAEADGAVAPDWRDQIGLQLYTVRDQFIRDYPGTLLKVAHIGYKEVQTTLTYAEYSPTQIREFLQMAGLRAPTTHVSPRMGPDFERTLEGYQLIGHRYTTVAFGPPRGAAAAAGGAPGAPGTARGAAGAPPPGALPPVGGEMAALPASMTQPQTLDSARRTAERLNEAGRITKKHGIKVMVHNHTNEFRRLADSPRIEYDVLLAETDPDLVAMELDIGWAIAAGQNVLEMFRTHPGRYEVWHVKDLAGLADLHALTDQIERMRGARIVVVGEGEIDYKPIFEQAALAGMKHFYVEQDTAPQSGDSIGAAAESYRNLARVLA